MVSSSTTTALLFVIGAWMISCSQGMISGGKEISVDQLAEIMREGRVRMADLNSEIRARTWFPESKLGSLNRQIGTLNNALRIFFPFDIIVK
jgi:hypothetical protein